MKGKSFWAIALLMVANLAAAQNVKLYGRVIQKLSSSQFHGRGYEYDGVKKAGAYLEKQFRKVGADKVVRQPFQVDVNTFPAAMRMSIDGKEMKPGTDFVVREFSPGVHGEYGVYLIDTLNYNSERIFADLAKPENKGAFVVCDYFWLRRKHREDVKRIESDTTLPNAGMIYTWDVPLGMYRAESNRVGEKPVIWTTADVIKDARQISLDVDNQFVPSYDTFNVVARVDGVRHDSCMVFVAHYDHLGALGKKCYFPGAHDNASGTAALVTLAEYYAHHRPKYDVWFVAVSGEELGLLGSIYFAEHPLFPLNQICYLINLDMIGDNNRTLYYEASPEGKDGLQLMEQINARKGYFVALNEGELGFNSDHYPFAQKGVPCVFFENARGDCYPFYHSSSDTWSRAVMGSYLPIFRLVTDFIRQY